MRELLTAVGLFLLLLLTGCAEQFACKTTIAYRADGSWEYQSCKNQENLKAKLGMDAQGKVNGLEVETTATTPEAVTAAAFQAVTQSLGILKDQLSTLKAGALAAGS